MNSADADCLHHIIIITSNPDAHKTYQNCAKLVDVVTLASLSGSRKLHKYSYHNGKITAEQKKQFNSTMSAGFEAYMFMLMHKLQGLGLVVYEHDNLLFEDIRNIIFQINIPYTIALNSDISFNWQQQHFIAASRAVYTFNADIKTKWRSRYVYQCHLQKLESLNGFLVACARRKSAVNPAAIKQPKKVTASKKNVKKASKKALLISYYMPPAETVAVHRLTYWHEMLPEIAKQKGEDLDVTILTAINAYENIDKYLVVPDLWDFGAVDEETQRLIEDCKAANINYFAAYWSKYIRRFFNNHSDMKYDTVIISGNPFYYFDLASYFKDNWGANVILDFRDPFANNPRFKYTSAHKTLVTNLENKYLSQADYALSVNKYCVDSLNLSHDNQGYVVANGYDERIISTIRKKPLKKKSRKTHFVYTGSFYSDRNAEPFLQALDHAHHKLVHIGRAAQADAHLDNYAALERYGLMPYSDVIGYCKLMQAGIIFTSGKAFEQTTKIFDYIATGLDIIIVTDGKIHTGELENITQNISGVYWVKNTPKAIQTFLNTYKPSPRRRSILPEFSRLKQTETLYDLICK